MKRHATIFSLFITSFLASVSLTSSTSALTYQQDIPVSFTFNSSVVLTLSSADLNIYNLSPGTSSDSNIIKVTATSNNSTGYVITATVGDNTHSNPSYSNTSLNHIGNTGNIFSSIATNADLASLTNDNTWGYAISDNGSTWSNYSGLPLYTAESGKTLKELNTNGTTSFDFKIAAKASSSQPSGEYRNVINFTLTSNAIPAPYMQDVATWGSTVTSGNEITVVDSRDGKSYTVARLADGNLWMTQNLDHDIDSTKTYTPADTDIPANWTPSTSTYTTTTWNGSITAPESYDPGTLYWSGIANDSTPVSSGNSHYHLGNYYNWTAAVAMNDTSSYITRKTLIDQSICPAGWTLPRVGSGEDTFYGLWSEYGYDDDSGTFSNISTLTGSPAYFAPTGYWYGYFEEFGEISHLWSPVVSDTFNVYGAGFVMDGKGYQSEGSLRVDGIPIRCIARPVTNTIRIFDQYLAFFQNLCYNYLKSFISFSIAVRKMRQILINIEEF